MERWKDIPNYSGYQVSDLGRIRTHNKTTKNKLYDIRCWKDRIMKQKITLNKRGRKDCRVDLWNNGEHKTLLVSRIVAFTFYEEDLNNRQLTVNHLNGNPLDNRLDNLELVSLKENIRHAFKTGLYSYQKKIKIQDKLTGTIVLASSLAEGERLLHYYRGYLSSKINNGLFENDRFSWELL